MMGREKFKDHFFLVRFFIFPSFQLHNLKREKGGSWRLENFERIIKIKKFKTKLERRVLFKKKINQPT